MSFKSLGLSDALLKAISKKGYETPSAIQQKAIPLILERKDAIYKMMNQMDEKSILLVLGKGREDYQEIGTEKIPYSDKETIEDYINAS